ncbi:MAG: hypothetical protein NTW86_19900 [Candidatus Sumerlaeota bacterium]|nr:hypothetical protein [Candidatus Sumerlaeota bacterium]
MKRLLALCSVLLSLAAANAHAQIIGFISVPDGFTSDTIALPLPFGGALGADPSNDQIVYCSVGGYGAMSLARVDLATKNVAIVADGPFGAVSGLAVLSPTQIAVIDNASAPGGPPDDTILLATDGNSDGDFNDAGEIQELIAPPLVNNDWTGSQARVAPAPDAAGIAGGSLVVQTADGSGQGRLLVVKDPLTSPSLVPAAGSFFTGFDYNGGFDFDSRGRVIMGSLNGTTFTGEVYALVNTNGDDHIELGEWNRLAAGENGMADLAIDAEDDVFFAGADLSFTAAVRSIEIPPDPLHQGAAAVNFATVDAGFLSGLLINSKTRPFESNAGPGGATMVIGGWTGGFESAKNLLTLTPNASPRQGPPTLEFVQDRQDGSALLGWSNHSLPPAMFLGFAWDAYEKAWVGGGAGGSLWHPYPMNATTGTLTLGYSGAYHVWISNAYWDGDWRPCLNPWTGIAYGGTPHTPKDVEIEDLGGLKVKLTWAPDVYGAWLDQAIVYEVGVGWISTQGPDGTGWWHFAAYPSAEFLGGSLELTLPEAGEYWVFLGAAGWLPPYPESAFAAQYAAVSE